MRVGSGGSRISGKGEGGDWPKATRGWSVGRGCPPLHWDGSGRGYAPEIFSLKFSS